MKFAPEQFTPTKWATAFEEKEWWGLAGDELRKASQIINTGTF